MGSIIAQRSSTGIFVVRFTLLCNIKTCSYFQGVSYWCFVEAGSVSEIRVAVSQLTALSDTISKYCAIIKQQSLHYEEGEVIEHSKVIQLFRLFSLNFTLNTHTESLN